MNIDNIFKCFPLQIQNLVKQNINKNEVEKLEEIRIRNSLPIILKIGQDEKIINYNICNQDINYIFQRICENSIYSYQNQIANGFITIQGGNRVGIIGTAVINNEKVTNFNYISSLNFRISRQVIGCSNSIINSIINKEENTIYNTLIISAPGVGKTTLLRDIIRNISNGIENQFKGINVAVIDERGEISATYKGVMQNNLGIRTDVINEIPKYIGMRMAIRSMAPKVIVADEIGNKEDNEAIKYAMCCGVKGIFTAHGKNMEEIMKNPELNNLINDKIFEKIIQIERNKDNINIFKIININFN